MAIQLNKFKINPSTFKSKSNPNKYKYNTNKYIQPNLSIFGIIFNKVKIEIKSNRTYIVSNSYKIHIGIQSTSNSNSNNLIQIQRNENPILIDFNLSIELH